MKKLVIALGLAVLPVLISAAVENKPNLDKARILQLENQVFNLQAQYSTCLVQLRTASLPEEIKKVETEVGCEVDWNSNPLSCKDKPKP